MNKPAIWELVSGAKNFLLDHLEEFKTQLKHIFPYVLVAYAVQVAAGIYDQQLLSGLAGLFVFYFTACFALSWHRLSLLGEHHLVKPFKVAKEDRSFLIFFFVLIIAPVLIYGSLGGLVALAGHFGGEGMAIPLAILFAVAGIYIAIQVLRFSFILPAKSVNADLSFADARRASKGLVWRLLAAAIMIGFVFWFLGMIYMMIVGIVMALFALSNGIIFLLFTVLLGIPALLIQFAMAAMNITVLSRLYQWGIQNNPL